MRDIKDDELKKLDENLTYQPVYSVIRRAERTFARISPNIPEVHKKTVREINWLLAHSCTSVAHAGDEFTFKKKYMYLQAARDDLFDVYHHIVFIVDGNGMTPGAANEVIVHVGDAHKQVCAWQSSEIRKNGGLQGGSV